jgi:hypothetical protein
VAKSLKIKRFQQVPRALRELHASCEAKSRMSQLRVKRNHLKAIFDPHTSLETGQERCRMSWASPGFGRAIESYPKRKILSAGAGSFYAGNRAKPAINSREINRCPVIRAAREKL